VNILIIYFTLIFVCVIFRIVYLRYRLKKIAIKVILNDDVNPGVRRVKNGPLKDFVHKLHRDYRTPLIQLYLFEKSIVILDDFYLYRNREAFGIYFFFNSAKSIILIPCKWLKKFDEEDIKFVICHEIRHASLWHLILKIRFFFNKKRGKEKTEMDANLFAAKILGKKQALKTIRKFQKVYNEFNFQKTISKIEKTNL